MTRTVVTQPRGSQGTLGETQVILPVPGLSSVVVDQVSQTTTRCVKWIITITNQISNDILAQEILAIDSNSGIKHSRYNIIGDNIPHTIQAAVSGGNIQLTVVNPTTDSFMVKLLRFEIV